MEVLIALLRVVEKAIDNPGATLRLLIVLASVASLWILVQHLQ